MRKYWTNEIREVDGEGEGEIKGYYTSSCKMTVTLWYDKGRRDETNNMEDGVSGRDEKKRGRRLINWKSRVESIKHGTFPKGENRRRTEVGVQPIP